MQFAEFLNLLYVNIGGEMSKSEFLNTLIENSIENPDDNPLSNLMPDTINRYFSPSGNTISKNKANKLIKIIQLSTLTTHIENQLTVDTIDRLADALHQYGLYTDDSELEISEICAQLFLNFLQGKVGIQTSKKELPYVGEIEITKVRYENGKIVIGSQYFQLPEKGPIPDSLVEFEDVYSKQLLIAYSENDGNPKTDYYNVQNLPQKYRNHLHDQRVNFFNADYVLRAIRDGFKDSEQQIALLKQETYDSISDILFEDYTTSFKKVTETLKHITTVSFSKPEITQIQNFIGNSEKKGLCHSLVNDGKFNWVDDNE